MKNTLLKTFAAGIALAALTLSPANASVIATESFQEYTGATPQDMEGKNGGSNWTSAWSSAGPANSTQVVAPGDNPDGNNIAPQLTYTSGSLSIDGGNRLGWFGEDMGVSVTQGLERTFSATSADNVYLSMLWQPDNKHGYRFGLSDADNDILGVEFNNGGLSARVRAADGSQSSFGTGVSSVSQSPHLLVIKLSKSTSGAANPYTDVSFFLDPSSATEPGTPSGSQSITTSFTSRPTSLDRVFFTAEGGQSFLDVFFDEVKVTTSFSDAVTPIPEPSSVSLILASVVGGTLLLRRRRR